MQQSNPDVMAHNALVSLIEYYGSVLRTYMQREEIYKATIAALQRELDSAKAKSDG